MRWTHAMPIAGAILLLANNTQGRDAATEELVLKLEDQRIHAMVARDFATLDRILADDLTYIHSRGELESKAEFLARLKSGDLAYKSMPREDVRVRVLGCAAVVTGKARVDVESKGEHLSFLLRFTDVYVERAGRWQMAAWQSSRMQ